MSEELFDCQLNSLLSETIEIIHSNKSKIEK